MIIELRHNPLALLASALLGIASLIGACGPKPEPEGPGPLATAVPTAPPDKSSAPVADPSAVATAQPVALPPLDPTNVGVPLPDESICDKNPDGSIKDPIPEGTYKGILRNAKCDQQKFLTMGRIAQALGVACNHCHAPHPTDPKKEDYPVMTERKWIANWMSSTLVRGLRYQDGSPMQCATCHRDQSGKPTPRILQDPRDPGFAQEWMNSQMTSRFMEAGGRRLKCKTCHVGVAPGQPGWLKDVKRKLRYTGDGVEREQG